MNLKVLLGFGIGLAAGIIGGVLGTKSHYKSKYKKEMEETFAEMEQYNSGANEYSRVYHDDQNDPEELEKNTEEIKEYRKQEKSDPVRYDKMYVPEETEVETREETETRQANEYHQKNKDREPRIISAEDAANLPVGWSEEPLYYYPEDDLLLDDFDNVVEDPSLLLGNCLEKYGFSDPNNDEDAIFVKNYQYDIVYWVQKVEGHFEPAE